MLGVMPRVLLVAGLVTTAIGLVLMASGLPIRDGTFDAEILTPGMIAAVGGLLLVGLSLAVRELRRIEQALALRPMPRVTRSGETMTAAAMRRMRRCVCQFRQNQKQSRGWRLWPRLRLLRLTPRRRTIS